MLGSGGGLNQDAGSCLHGSGRKFGHWGKTHLIQLVVGRILHTLFWKETQLIIPFPFQQRQFIPEATRACSGYA